MVAEDIIVGVAVAVVGVVDVEEVEDIILMIFIVVILIMEILEMFGPDPVVIILTDKLSQFDCFLFGKQNFCSSRV